MKEKEQRPVMRVHSFVILPYQQKRLKELAKAMGKTQSELVREALSLLFREWEEMTGQKIGE